MLGVSWMKWLLTTIAMADGLMPQTTTTMSTKKPLKVAIAGGGVGGLTSALTLLKKGIDVTVYEKTQEFARFGGPIQFASNALSTLKAIDEDLFVRVMSEFTFTGTRRCGIKDGLRSDGSFRMTPVMDLKYIFDKTVPPDWFVSFPLKECADFFQLPYTGVVDRPVLQDILLDECKKRKSDFIKNGNPVVGYSQNDDGVTVQLADGSTEDADILIGADGIWSAVRAQMYQEGDVKRASKDGLEKQGCRYSGYTVFAGEAVMADLPDYDDVGYNVYIGSKRYFVKSDVGQGRVQWYAFCSLPPGTQTLGDTWAGDFKGDAKKGQSVIDEISALHEGWSPEILEILKRTPPEAVEQRDLYDRPLNIFQSWADGRVVLLGDAVHPMMPNLGQGGCQAIEDAYVLGKSISASMLASNDLGVQFETSDISTALQTFFKQRILRVATVSFLSRIASDLIVNAFDTPWGPHDDVVLKDKQWSWKSYLTFAWKPVLQYLIFPSQFLFLYSFAPTGPMGDLPKKLESQWRLRHQQDRQDALDTPSVPPPRVPSFFQQEKQQTSSNSSFAIPFAR